MNARDIADEIAGEFGVTLERHDHGVLWYTAKPLAVDDAARMATQLNDKRGIRATTLWAGDRSRWVLVDLTEREAQDRVDDAADGGRS